MDNPTTEPNDLKLETFDEELKIFSCSYPNCDYNDSREDHVARHEKSHDPAFNWDLFCQICPDSFGSVVSFLHHMYTQHADELLCPLCKFQAEDWTEFKPHILTHSLTFNCVPTISDNVGNHVTTVLRCAICAIIFTSKESLSQHLKKCCRKLKPLQSVAKKMKADKLDQSQESFEHSKLMEESGIYTTNEISNGDSGSSTVVEEATVECILGL